MPKRLVICFDGTWNTPDKSANVTNVVKLLRAVAVQDGDISQISFYDRGVGTGGPLDSIAGGASGKGLTRNMVDGYRFLANNYAEGDEIYIFGFSRGAYTARSLAGFVGLIGMISPLGLGGQLDDALNVYRDESLNREQKRQRLRALDEQYGFARREEVRIRCVGVWDTVGSLGIPGDLGRRLVKKYYFHDVQLSDRIDVALHAVAIDEKRSAFAPTLWVRKPDGPPPPPGQTVEQVWFSGVHSNIGGSYTDAGLSDTTLDWMIKRVRALTGLVFDDDYIRRYVTPDALGKGVESRTLPLYLDSRAYPYQRLIDQIPPKEKGFGGWFRKKFSRLDRRNIPPDGLKPVNEMLHVSVLERWKSPVVWDCPEDKQGSKRDYRPPTLAAVIDAHRAGQSIPVVGYDGQVMPAQDVPWPE